MGICIKDHIDFKTREDLSTDKDILESLFVELKLDNKTKTIIPGVLYHPPNSNLREFEEFVEELLDNINVILFIRLLTYLFHKTRQNIEGKDDRG